MEKEEGEMSDDNAMLVDDEDAIIKDSAPQAETMIYKADKNGLVIQQLERIDATKLEERAKRFGLNLTNNRVVTQRQIDELYSNLGIESENERHFRFDTLHLHGINGLTTREVFEYLEDYKPLSLECIDDMSCNVVCQDHVSAALALLVHSQEIKRENYSGLRVDRSHHWRLGLPYRKKDGILMRFATNGDKKIPMMKPKNTDEYYDRTLGSISKNPWGDLSKSWGVYDHQEILNRKLPKVDNEIEKEEPAVIQIKNKKLAMRLGKRTAFTEESEDSSSDSEWNRKPKAPRMRMHADDEETKLKKKQEAQWTKEVDTDFYAPLSIEVINSHSVYTPRPFTKLSDKFKSETRQGDFKGKGKQKESIQSRLGVKVMRKEDEYLSDGYISDNSDHIMMSRVQKVNDRSESSDVWTRLESKARDSSAQKDLRHVLKSKKQHDLRDRISKQKKSNLHIEIQND